MANYLRQATTASILLGPFLDDVDGRSAETGLTIPAASMYASKRGGSPIAINSGSAAKHTILGFYTAVLDDTDTASAGDLVIVTAPSGALPVWRAFNVMAPSAYDSLVLGASTIPATIIAGGIGIGAFAASSIAASVFAGSSINNSVLAAAAGSVIWDSAVRTVTGGSVVATSGSVVTTSNLDKTGYVLGASSISGSTIAASTIDNGVFSVTGASQVWNVVSRIVTGGSVVATSGSVVTTSNLDKTGYSIAACSISASNISDNTLYAIADEALIRDWTAISACAADRSTLNALRFLRNKWSISGSTLTVTKENDSTAAWTAELTSSSSADPVVGSDPA